MQPEVCVLIHVKVVCKVGKSVVAIFPILLMVILSIELPNNTHQVTCVIQVARRLA